VPSTLAEMASLVSDGIATHKGTGDWEQFCSSLQFA
jgi:hypothetical protein